MKIDIKACWPSNSRDISKNKALVKFTYSGYVCESTCKKKENDARISKIEFG